MDVVGNSQTVTRSGATRSSIEDPLEVVLGDLDVGQLVVVVGVEVEVANYVAEVFHSRLACGAAGAVRGTHVGRVFSDDVADGHFILDHLVDALLFRDLAQVGVTPCVGGDLMAISYHTLDNSGPGRCGVDGTFAVVVTSHEEGSLEAVGSELIQDAVGVEIWTVCVS